MWTCGKEISGKSRTKFPFSLEEDPNPFDWVSDLSGWIIFYLHISCILNFRRRKKYWFKPIFFLLRDLSETKKNTEFILYIGIVMNEFEFCVKEDCVYFLSPDILVYSFGTTNKTQYKIL